MTFHLAGYSASQDSAVLLAAAGIPDQSLQVNVNDVIVPSDLNNLLAAYVLGPNVTRAALVSPSLRSVFNQELFGIDVAATPTEQLLLEWYGQNAIPLAAGEPLTAQFAESAAGVSRGTVLVWLCDTVPQPIMADIRTIRVSSAQAVIANVWSNINLTFNDSLPSGTWGLAGAMLQSANMQAFRFVFKGGYYRPGAIGLTTLTQRENPLFRHGNMGIWGPFENLTPPSVDILANGADASFQGVLDLVRLG